MFNLEESITDWRRRMLAAGIKSPEPLEELESHLRDEFEQRVKSGLSEPAAFHSAVVEIGPAGTLKWEFAKAAGTGQVLQGQGVWVGRISSLSIIFGLTAWL